MISITLESVSRVDIEDEWNFSNDTEFTMHSIHTPSEINDFRGGWSEMGDSNSRHLAPKPMSEPSGRTESHSLALSVAPAVPF